SSTMFSDKNIWFTAIENMTILPVSHWLAQQVNVSFLNKYPIKPIYNWVDSDIFKPSDKSTFNNSYNLDLNKFTLIVVSAEWRISDVKWGDLLKLADAIDLEYQIVVVGKVEKPDLLPNNCVVLE